MYYIEFTEKRGRMSEVADVALSVNMENVESFKPNGDGTILYFKSGREQMISQSYESVRKELSLK